MAMPALLKGWIDRVFSYGFAYTKKNEEIVGLLNNIKVDIVMTMGSKLEDYKKNGLYNSFKNGFEKGIFNFCNIEIKKWFIFSDVLNANYNKINMWLNNIKKYYSKK